jgi:hypothetical protein
VRARADVDAHGAALLRRRLGAEAADRRHQRSVLDVLDPHRPALDEVVVVEHLLLDPRAVDQRAVGAAAILDDEAAVLHADLRVQARHHRVVGPDRALGATADQHGVRRRQIDLPAATLAVLKQYASAHGCGTSYPTEPRYGQLPRREAERDGRQWTARGSA